MAGPAKNRAQREKKATGSSEGNHSTQNSSNRLSPQSLAQGDASRDPGAVAPRPGAPIEYTLLKDLKNITEFLGMGGWCWARGYVVPDELPLRPKKFNTLGKEVTVKLNTYNVLNTPTKPVQQYDILVNTGTEKRALIKKLWQSQAVQSVIGKNDFWLFDGNKLAWSMKDTGRPEIRVDVDLDKEEGRTPKPGKENRHRVFIKKTKIVDFAGLYAFLRGQGQWSNDCIDTVNMLDHCMRENPSHRFTQIKRSFFERGQTRFDLGGGIEAFKGFYSSLRPCLSEKLEQGLTVNLDVANGTFWKPQPLVMALIQTFNVNGLPDIQNMFNNARRDWRNSFFKKDLNRFKRLEVVDVHREKETPPKVTTWTIDKFVEKDPTEITFKENVKDAQGKKTDQKRDVKLSEYFAREYSMTLSRNVPVVQMTKKINGGPVYLPIEALRIEQNQRYNAKLNERQTSQMIRFAVTLPKERWEAVEHGKRCLDWGNDPYLKHYGIRIASEPTKVKARVLNPPSVMFGANKSIPGRTAQGGRWQVTGQKFLSANTVELDSWGVGVVEGRGAVTKQAAEKFAEAFVQIYKGHGGKFSARGHKPIFAPVKPSRGGEMVTDLWNATGNHFQRRPQLMFFVVNDRNADFYRRLKKSCDCRYGVVSQVVQGAHVVKAQPQYISNVCLKVNAKLGGTTSQAKGTDLGRIAPASAKIPTMVIGADVSHPAPGAGSVDATSFAALTMSADRIFARYLAQVDANGNRVEMVATNLINNHLGKMAKWWVQHVGGGACPQRVLYMRDGVSEGQYSQVIDQEVRDMKIMFKALNPKANVQFTVLVAGKRHHLRFFPETRDGQDQNGNPLPGTLIETGCTHPFEFDFYLCSHKAIKGTARPIHYQVILNEGKWGGEEIQQFVFEHSFQYMRSTTPVSLFPAIYYAHLAADRARAHENTAAVSSGKKEQKQEKPQTTTSSDKKNTEVIPLLPMPLGGGINETMWYI